MIEIVGERGYGAVTVRELTQLAGVSTRAFYENFEGKEECFVRTYEMVVREAAVRIRDGQRCEGGGWSEHLREASLVCARELERHPRAARLALVEAPTAGPAALERMRDAECIFRMLVGASFAGAPDGVGMPSVLAGGIAAGVEGVARARLLAGRERELPGVAADLLEWAFSYRCEAAVKVVRLEGGPTHISDYEPDRVDRTPLGDERERILSAVAKLAAANGYLQQKVPRVRTEAGVSRRCFDSHFKDVEDCFLASIESRVDRALAHATRAAADSPTWAGSIHLAIADICVRVASDPVLAKLAFVEVFAPGSEGVLCRERLLAKIVGLFRDSTPLHHRPSELVTEASVNAIWGVVHHDVVSGRSRQLPRIAPALSFLALAPAIGGPAAADVILQAQTTGGALPLERRAA